MGTNFDPLVAYSFLFMTSLSDDNQADIIEVFIYLSVDREDSLTS